MVVEPTAALGLAGLEKRARDGRVGGRVGVILSGGNLDLSAIPGLVALAGGVES